MAHKTLIGGTGYNITGGRTLIGGTGYNITGGRTLIDGTGYDISFFPAKKALNDTSWADIAAIAAAGKASEYWAVGDRKAITVNGTVGTLSVNDTFYVYILGFNHNDAVNCIDFGTFKNSISATAGDICLVDQHYGTSITSATKAFNVNHSAGSTVGGWKGCGLRYDILGSTNAKGSDASVTTATSPVANTLMAALPSDLRAVMKPMTIYTDNVGARSGGGANVSASIDYLPLLAEYEIFGARSYANSGESAHQKRYAFFQNGNSPIKGRQSDGAPVILWTRSPSMNPANRFCSVSATGGNTQSTTQTSLGIAPIFRV